MYTHDPCTSHNTHTCTYSHLNVHYATCMHRHEHTHTHTHRSTLLHTYATYMYTMYTYVRVNTHTIRVTLVRKMHTHTSHMQNTHKCTHTYIHHLLPLTHVGAGTLQLPVSRHSVELHSTNTYPWLHSKEAEYPGTGMGFRVKLLLKEVLPLLGKCRGLDSTVAWSNI